MRLLLLLILLLPTLTFAQEDGGGFVPLVGIPFVETGQVSSLGEYVNALYLAAISIAAFLAVLKIIVAGVQYMLSEVVTSKEQAKKSIYGAIVGLLIVLGAFLILNTINPTLTNLTNLDGPTSFRGLEGEDREVVYGYRDIPIDENISTEVLKDSRAQTAIKDYIKNCEAADRKIVINDGISCNQITDGDSTVIDLDDGKDIDTQQTELLASKESEGFTELLNSDIDIHTNNDEEIEAARVDCERRGGDEFVILNHGDNLGRIFCFSK